MHECWEALMHAPLRYNPLHDLESLWWISSYFLLTHAVVDGDDAPDEKHAQARAEQLDRQCTSVERLFVDGSERHWVMIMESNFQQELCCLHRSMRKAGAAVAEARDALAKAYHYAEKDMKSREFSVRAKTYDTMRRRFSYVSKHLRKHNVKTEPLDVC